MEDKILASILLRPGMKDANQELVKDMISDCISELRDSINYKKDDPLPEALYGVIKELVLTKYNLDGTEGIASESQSSGGSTSYMSDLPQNMKRSIYKYRKLRR